MRLAERICVLTLFTLIGCGGGPHVNSSPDLAIAPGDMTFVPTACTDPRADTYMADLTKPTNPAGLTVTLVDSDPGPPIMGTNVWTIKITDAGGAPVSGAGITVLPWMPDHGHGTSVKALVAPGNSDGEYTISQVYLFMAGLWTVTLTITPPGSSTSYPVVFSFCIVDPSAPQ